MLEESNSQEKSKLSLNRRTFIKSFIVRKL